jgi:hypothetical protein
MQEFADNYFKYTIRLLPGATANQLIAYLITQIQIHSFIESIPSMNDIFIRSVTGQTSAINSKEIVF